MRLSGFVCAPLVTVLAACATSASSGAPGRPPAIVETSELAQRVEVRRTTYGVPQILAEDLRAAAFGLAYVQAQDYGERVIRGIVGARGESALVDGYSVIDDDFQSRRRWARAAETLTSSSRTRARFTRASPKA